ncbi:hypothetical protein TpMuguga_04g00521 [Theileria parva strain Muguga]|uniref:Uncharacterized protein n=1 Tax=Theileria parva TaxID=5875 RepID=Q4N3M1_THEPA|nr:uncharacterized protein TpMuguga_04g00521 [Theileria parva strain Muguga]EAN31873.1 hypothetical protein TpMuguga_04g00521 [Theileria parva strain Muguga]|eukprot:XP_764156.1 hypothetical protein [Theileria parva strain Muguga]
MLLIRYRFYLLVNKRFVLTEKPPKELRLSFQQPAPKHCIGFRGNHQHGKKLYDQVYPTSKIPSVMVPRYPLDWRNAGRFILTCGLARIEGKRLYRHPHSLNYQDSSHCGPRCANVCSSSHYKCLCSMRSDESHLHISHIDSMLMSYKGPVTTNKPIFSVMNQVAKKNETQSHKLSIDDSSKSYRIIKRTYRYSAFQDRDNKPTSIHHNLVSHMNRFNIFNVMSP